MPRSMGDEESKTFVSKRAASMMPIGAKATARRLVGSWASACAIAPIPAPRSARLAKFRYWKPPAAVKVVGSFTFTTPVRPTASMIICARDAPGFRRGPPGTRLVGVASLAP